MLAHGFGPIPLIVGVTSEGSDQTAINCSLFRAFACQQSINATLLKKSHEILGE